MVMNLHMARLYPTNYGMLEYPGLTHPVFTYTVIAGTVYKRVKKNVQVYGIYFWLDALVTNES